MKNKDVINGKILTITLFVFIIYLLNKLNFLDRIIKFILLLFISLILSYIVYPIHKKITKKFFTFSLEKGNKGGKKLQEKAGRNVYFALFLFVGIPLPGTGAWTGTLAASLLNLDFNSIPCSV